MIRKTMTALMLTATVLTGGAALASDDLPLNDAVRASITEKLTAEGYEVGKVKIEDGRYEAYAKRDGKKYEVFLNAALDVVEVKDD